MLFTVKVFVPPPLLLEDDEPELLPATVIADAQVAVRFKPSVSVTVKVVTLVPSVV